MFSLFVRRDGLIDPPAIGEQDSHCHILHGLDDGPSTLAGSLDIARVLLEMGIRQVIATPHVISDIYPNTRKTIEDAVCRLSCELKRESLPLLVIPAAEYYVENAFLSAIRDNDVLCFGPEKYVLFESPLDAPPRLLNDVIYHLRSNGYTPLLAHAERYPFLQNHRKQVHELKALGVHFQVNHPSFMLPRTSRTGEMARWLYIKGLVDTLGTDMHRVTRPAMQRDDTRKPLWFLRQR